MKLIQGLIPPGGWHFIQDGAVIRAQEYSHLVKAVESFRAENKLPSVDAAKDITEQICNRSPNACHGVDSVVVRTHKAKTLAKGNLIQDITIWASNLLKRETPFRLVGDELAESRAKICRGCPSNLNWRSGCRSCITAADRICASVRQGRDTKSSKVLGGCEKLRQDNRTAIFLEKEFLTKNPNIPDYCWLNS